MGHEETLLWCCHALAPRGTGPVALPEAARQSCFFSKASLRSSNVSLPLAGNGILASSLQELLLIKEGELPVVGACPGARGALLSPGFSSRGSLHFAWLRLLHCPCETPGSALLRG